MDLSKMGLAGEVVDSKNVSVECAGEFLELAADYIAQGKPLPLPLAMTLAPALYDAATKAKAGDQKGAVSALASGTGLQTNHRRSKAPYWATVSRIAGLIEAGDSQTKAIKTAAKEQGIGKSTADDYWTKYQEQELEVCQLVEAAIRKQ
ncbi:hypothetical protein P7F88_12650 [Vibrio hannami]|uniref:hypothetical protein n=1 Tax=Vibrio hannami TaxID=2717094 RepID=UPI002410945E|nr:hypothetical protein [Vibrio hannami]MDG3086893.1 hypothetical protein [Vibrio hannami]